MDGIKRKLLEVSDEMWISNSVISLYLKLCGFGMYVNFLSKVCLTMFAILSCVVD